MGTRFDLVRLPRDLSEVHAIGARGARVAEVNRRAASSSWCSADGHGIAAFVEGAKPRRSLNAGRRRASSRPSSASARESAILDSALDSIWSWTRRAHREFNSAAEETFGYRKAEVISHRGRTIVPPRLRESHRLGFLRRQPGVDDLGLNRRTETIMRADGRELPVAAGKR